ncbi:MAG: hypothetical protein ABEJ23_05120 [Haloarculaceae archaeon]
MRGLEVNRTVERVQVLEKLQIDLDITESQYQSDHTMEGEVRAFVNPDKEAIRDRESPPVGLSEVAASAVASSSFPSERFFVGLYRTPPVSQDDEAHREDRQISTVDVDGVPENGTLEFEADWSAGEARQALSEGEMRVLKRQYDIAGLPHDRQPVIVRANLYRDAVTLAEKLDANPSGDTEFQQYEGLAGLAIEVELRETTGGRDVLRIDRLNVDLSRTFPQIEYEPFSGATYDPEAKRITWTRGEVTPGSAATYVIFGPIGQLIDVDRVNASFRGTLSGSTVSGVAIEDVYDESGAAFTGENGPAIDHTVTVGLDAEIDPGALAGKAQEVSRATVSVSTTPEDLYAKLRDVCTSNGIHIRESSDVGDAEPVLNRDGVFEVTEHDGNAGRLSVKKEYGDRGVVYADLTVTGKFTAISQESQVSAFDESEDRLVRADMGGLDSRGESAVEIKARSAASELSSELIGTFEQELGGQS